MIPKSREVIYIAGPFTSSDNIVVACNCNAANALARRVRALGYVPFVPHTGLAGGQAALNYAGAVYVGLSDLGWEEAMVECRELLQRCDAVLMVEGWQKSRGATEERTLAKSCGIPVFDSVCEMLEAELAIEKKPAVEVAP